MKEINVGLAECVISRNPDDILVAYGLGSCIGVVMIDPVSKFSGLLHAVLPRISDGAGVREINPYKYVESGIETLITTLKGSGSNQSKLIVRIVGGSNMIMSSDATHPFDIGTRNIEAACTTLKRLKMPILTAEVGGHTGRTVRVYIAESRVTVRVIGEKEHEI